MTAFLSPDLARITMLDADYFRREPFETPYVSTFAAHGRSLCFVACEHTVGLESATHRTLETAFAEQSPQCVVLEGIPSGDPELAAQKSDPSLRARIAAQLARTSCDSDPSELVECLLDPDEEMHDAARDMMLGTPELPAAALRKALEEAKPEGSERFRAQADEVLAKLPK